MQSLLVRSGRRQYDPRRLPALLTVAVALPLALAGCSSDETTDKEQGTDRGFASLNAPAQKLVRYSFTDLGASRTETRCSVEALVDRIGAAELNSVAKEFKAGDTRRYLSHRLALAAVAEECDVDDHREVGCDNPRDAEERSLCREFERITPGMPIP